MQISNVISTGLPLAKSYQRTGIARTTRTQLSARPSVFFPEQSVWLIGRESDWTFFESEYPRNLAHNSHTEFEINVVPTSE
jgi:hypothetical protein